MKLLQPKMSTKERSDDVTSLSENGRYHLYLSVVFHEKLTRDHNKASLSNQITCRQLDHGTAQDWSQKAWLMPGLSAAAGCSAHGP